jgi:hypothetical protein
MNLTAAGRRGPFLAMLVAMSLSAGCTREDESTRALRNSFSPKIEQAHRFTYIQRAYPGDGGSLVFHFKTDKGLSVLITAKHQLEKMGGNSKYQEIRLSDSWNYDGFELRKGSLLEEKVLELLKTSLIGDGSGCKYPGERPTRESLDWLVARTKDRSLKGDRPQ